MVALKKMVGGLRPLFFPLSSKGKGTTRKREGRERVRRETRHMLLAAPNAVASPEKTHRRDDDDVVFPSDCNPFFSLLPLVRSLSLPPLAPLPRQIVAPFPLEFPLFVVVERAHTDPR
jgi:hypothetical protein